MHPQNTNVSPLASLPLSLVLFDLLGWWIYESLCQFSPDFPLQVGACGELCRLGLGLGQVWAQIPLCSLLPMSPSIGDFKAHVLSCKMEILIQQPDR